MNIESNKLSEIKKKNPFTVPEGYFDRINEEIMNRLPEKEARQPATVSMWEKAKPWVYMAAMFMGLFFSIQLLTKNAKNQGGITRNGTANTTEESAQIPDTYWSTVRVSEEEFYQYIEEQLVRDGYYDYMYNQVSMTQ